MKIFAIDPGTEESAWLFAYDLWDGKLLFKEFGKDPNARVMGLLRQALLCADDVVVPIEEIRCYGMPIGHTTLEAVKWTGRFWQICGPCVRWVGRKEIVSSLCGSAKAKDSNVRRALIDIYGEPGTKKKPGLTYGISKDVWSALAIAHYAATVK